MVFKLSPASCVYCKGRLVTNMMSEQYIGFPADNAEIEQEFDAPRLELEPIQPGDYCCTGPEYSTPLAAYERACGRFD